MRFDHLHYHDELPARRTPRDLTPCRRYSQRSNTAGEAASLAGRRG
ncbi:MAG: hypothetical protein OEY41_02290 [Acidimicrobiia bacterium]|nr:hypothetical protein [Acidimicrobiia bacterium]MDH5288806.1 hypothetical protein [Acidimicrobiia bacterium]